MSQLAAEELLESSKCDRQAGERERRARETLEGELCAPAGVRQRRDRAGDGDGVRLEPVGAAGEELERGVGDEARREERLVHAVAAERVDEAGGVADHGGRAARETRLRATQRQAVPALVGRGVRIDSHAYTGYTVPPNYDSLIAKLIAVGATRKSAIARMRRALGEYLITGIKTTIPFHNAIMRNADFRNGHYDTGFVDRMMKSEAFELRPSNGGLTD